MSDSVHKEDIELAKQLMRGKEQAFNSFFNLYYARVFRFCMRRASEADAEEIAVETLRQAIRRIETYRGEASLMTWLYQVARSQVSAHYKRQSKHQNLVLLEDSEQVQAEVEAMAIELSETPEGLREQAQQKHLVHYMLDSLPSDYGKILEWKYVEGCSVDEIAEKLSTSPTAIQSMLARARTAFRKTYAQITQQLSDNVPITLHQPGEAK
jgi:RNA polymerase sigma-70 factor (ECF subfamily)